MNNEVLVTVSWNYINKDGENTHESERFETQYTFPDVKKAMEEITIKVGEYRKALGERFQNAFITSSPLYFEVGKGHGEGTIPKDQDVPLSKYIIGEGYGYNYQAHELAKQIEREMFDFGEYSVDKDQQIPWVAEGGGSRHNVIKNIEAAICDTIFNSSDEKANGIEPLIDYFTDKINALDEGSKHIEKCEELVKNLNIINEDKELIAETEKLLEEANELQAQLNDQLDEIDKGLTESEKLLALIEQSGKELDENDKIESDLNDYNDLTEIEEPLTPIEQSEKELDENDKIEDELDNDNEIQANDPDEHNELDDCDELNDYDDFEH